QSTLGQRVGKRGTDRAGPNNHDFSWSPCVTHNSFSFLDIGFWHGIILAPIIKRKRVTVKWGRMGRGCGEVSLTGMGGGRQMEWCFGNVCRALASPPWLWPWPSA